MRLKEKNFCINCQKERVKKNNRKFCSNSCQLEFQYKEYIEKWRSGEIINTSTQISNYIRRFLLEKFSERCSKCGWGEKNPFTGNSVLEVHHIDGDATNNIESNLDLLCPNCHSLTETFRMLNNKGSTRKRHN